MDLIGGSFYISLLWQAALLCGLFLARREIADALRPAGRWNLALLAALFLAALAVRLWLVPHRHYVFYDEYEHLNIAKNLADSNLFGRCHFYLDGACYSYWLPQWLPGYHSLLAWVYRAAGATAEAAFVFNATAASLAVPLAFAAALLVFGSPAAGLVSAVALAFMPLHLKFSGNASTEAVSLTFILLAFFSWGLAEKARSAAALFFAVCATAFAAGIRAENGILLPLFAAFLYGLRLPRPVLRAVSPACLLFLPYFLYLPAIRAFMTESWLAAQAGVSGAWLLFRNTAYLASDAAIPVTAAAAAAAGAAGLYRRNKAWFWTLAAYLGLLLTAYSCVEKLEMYKEESQRFFVPVLAVLVVLAGGLPGFLAGPLARLRPAARPAALVLAGALMIFNFVSRSGFVTGEITNPEFYSQRAALAAEPPAPGRVYVTYNPSFVISVLGASSVHISYLFDEKVYAEKLKGRDLVLVDDFWCGRNISDFCGRAKAGRFPGPLSSPGGAKALRTLDLGRAERQARDGPPGFSGRGRIGIIPQ